MVETVERQQLLEALWDAELGRVGRDVVIKLNHLGPLPGTSFLFPLPEGKCHPTRRYVEEWLEQDEAKITATNTLRFWCIVVVDILSVIICIISAWPVNITGSISPVPPTTGKPT